MVLGIRHSFSKHLWSQVLGHPEENSWPQLWGGHSTAGTSEAAGVPGDILTPPGLLGQGTECGSPCFTPTMEKAESAREPELLATGLGPSRYAFQGLGRNWQCRVWPSGGLHDEGEETALSRGHKSMKTGCRLGNVSAHLCLLILGASAVWLCGSGPGRQDQTALVRAQLRLLSMLTSVKQAESHRSPPDHFRGRSKRHDN